MKGGHVRPWHGHGRYGVVRPKAPDIVAIGVRKIRHPHHTIGRRLPRRCPAVAASVVEHGNDHYGSEPSRCVHSSKMTFPYDHQGVTCTSPSAARVGRDGEDLDGGWEHSV